MLDVAADDAMLLPASSDEPAEEGAERSLDEVDEDGSRYAPPPVSVVPSVASRCLRILSVRRSSRSFAGEDCSSSPADDGLALADDEDKNSSLPAGTEEALCAEDGEESLSAGRAAASDTAEDDESSSESEAVSSSREAMRRACGAVTATTSRARMIRMSRRWRGRDAQRMRAGGRFWCL
jgi:hypothetical protein